MKIKSPITGSKNISLEKHLAVLPIIEGYQKAYGIDVSRFFKSIKDIDLYRCHETGYLFFYPFTIAGDGAFYEDLEKFPWYYMESKWEHHKTLEVIKQGYGKKILEIGSAQGAFLKTMRARGYDVTGLEFNEHAAHEARRSGLHVITETIEDHARKNPHTYDVVCSFQVLEHVTDVHSFIQASIDTLKPGGRLIFSVPNNDSFLKEDTKGLLNIPPHHMGLWGERALKNIAPVFNVTFEKLYTEPLQEYHLGTYFGITIKRISLSNFRIARVLGKLIPYKIGVPVLRMMKNFIKGHTVLVVYTKN